MKPARILIVEDERIIALTLRQMLEDRGYAVVGMAASGAATIEQTARLRPDLVLMDIHLEGDMDGIAAAGTIHERERIPVVFLTAYAEDAMLRRSRLSLPDGYLVKPIDARELHATIQMALARRTAQLALERSEQRLHALLAGVPIGIFQTDVTGNYIYVNTYWQQLTGGDLHRAQGDGWLGGVHAEDRARARAAWEAQLERRQDFTLEYRLRAPTQLWVTSQAVALRDEQGEFCGYLGTLTDITQRKQRQDELLSTRDRLRGLVERLQTDREAERARVARKLYEGIAQQVSGIQMQVAALLTRLGKESAGSAATLDELNGLFNEALAAIGDLASALRPAMLNVLGLEAAAQLLVHDFEKRTSVACRFGCALHESIERLDARATTVLYRILEDLLREAARYSDLSALEVTLQRTLEEVVLRVRYQSATAAAKQVSPDMALLAIEERVAALRGSFRRALDRESKLSFEVCLPSAASSAPARLGGAHS